VISAELRAKIRRLYFGEHWKIGTIARELGVGHETVERAIESERFGPRCASRPVVASILDPYKPLLLEALTQYPRLRATRLWQMAKQRGYAGSEVVVRRWARTVRPAPRGEAYFRLSTLPGEQAQVDWGHFGRVSIGRAQRPLVCFVLVLSYSRAMYARFALDQSMESLLRGHVLAFEALGGAPRTILYDNMKSVVLEREGEHVRYHPRLLELAGHYHFAPRPCAPYRATEKGKVERAIQYLRHSFFEARRFSSVEDLNSQLSAWIDEVAHVRFAPGDPDRHTVTERLALEASALLALPAHRFETDLVAPTASGKQPYVRFDTNDYSIPHALVCKPLTLVVAEHELRVLDGALEVARHRRSYDRRAVVEDPAHLHELAAQKRHARELRGRDRLRACCPSVDLLLAEIVRRGNVVSSQTQRLLRLLDRFGAAELEAAVAEAIERGAYSAQSVEHICDRRVRARGVPPPIAVQVTDPRIRDVRVVPHSLGPYDTLGKKHKSHEEPSE
jgi:transposase